MKYEQLTREVIDSIVQKFIELHAKSPEVKWKKAFKKADERLKIKR